jgi:hypothetical protein
VDEVSSRRRAHVLALMSQRMIVALNEWVGITEDGMP